MLQHSYYVLLFRRRYGTHGQLRETDFLLGGGDEVAVVPRELCFHESEVLGLDPVGACAEVARHDVSLRWVLMVGPVDSCARKRDFMGERCVRQRAYSFIDTQAPARTPSESVRDARVNFVKKIRG